MPSVQETIVRAMDPGEQLPMPNPNQEWTFFFNEGQQYGIDMSQVLGSLREELQQSISDDDGDGVINIYDELKGYDDNLPRIDASNGQKFVKIEEGKYATFNANGDLFGPFVRVIGQEVIDGSPSVSVGFSRDGASFSFSGNDQIKYILEVIPTP